MRYGITCQLLQSMYRNFPFYAKDSIFPVALSNLDTNKVEPLHTTDPPAILTCYRRDRDQPWPSTPIAEGRATSAAPSQRKSTRCLQAGAVDDLHVDSELAATVVEDEDTDGAATGLESLAETGIEVGLVNDGETLLDVASLGHGDDLALLHVEDAVLLEDRAEHGLDDNTGGGVGDERGLLVQLLGEEVG